MPARLRLSEVRDRLARRERSARPPAVSAGEDTNRRSPPAEGAEGLSQRETTPERPPRVPAAIAHDLERDLGWPRALGLRTRPGNGPLVSDFRTRPGRDG